MVISTALLAWKERLSGFTMGLTESELRSAYPTHDFGVPFEFHRVFAVGHKAG